MFDDVSKLRINNDEICILKLEDRIIYPKDLVLYEYLENVGNSHIDIGFPMKTSYTIEGKLQYNKGNQIDSQLNGFLAEYSLRENSSSNQQVIFSWVCVHKTNKTLYDPSMGSWASTTSDDHFVGNEPFVFKASLAPNYRLWLNGVSICDKPSGYGVQSPTTNSVLFKYKYKESPINSYGFNGKCYWCKIYGDNGELLRNFLPCTYKNEPGFWDTVSNLFFGNKGSDNFVVGNETNEIHIPFISSLWTYSNYQNRTSSSVLNGVYKVNGYLNSSSIDTSFSAISKGYVTLPSNTTVILSFMCKFKSDGAVYFVKRTDPNHPGLYTNSAYGTCTSLIGINETTGYSIANVTTIHLGTQYEGRVEIPIQTTDDTLYQIKIGFDNPNFYGVGSFIEFSDVKITIPQS